VKTRPHLTHRILIAALIVVLAFSVAPCQPGEAYAPEQRPVPLYFAIDNFGHISATSGDMGVPTRMVVTKKPLSPDILHWMGNRLLIVRFDGKDAIFDLRDHSVNAIQFDRGYYSATHLKTRDNALILEAQRTFVMNEQPMQKLVNDTQITTKTGRRSCLESAFTSRGMYGVVRHAVRLRKQPYVPEDLDENWTGSLRSDERVYVSLTYCNAGVWLKVERYSGRVGWAKEWGLTEDLVEILFIDRYKPPPPTVTPRFTRTPFQIRTPTPSQTTAPTLTPKP